MIRTSFLSCHLVVLILLPVTGISGTINTADIVFQTTTAALSCMRWMPVGVCFWLRCSPYECTVESSIKVGHYQPDAVVSSYNELGGNPWVEIRATLGLAQKAAATGFHALTSPHGREPDRGLLHWRDRAGDELPATRLSEGVARRGLCAAGARALASRGREPAVLREVEAGPAPRVTSRVERLARRRRVVAPDGITHHRNRSVSVVAKHLPLGT